MPVSAAEQSRIDQTIKTFYRYNLNPFVTDFLREEAKKVAALKVPRDKKSKSKTPKPEHIPISKYDKPQLFRVMRNVLLGKRLGDHRYVLQHEAMLAYVDRLQATGKQHVYLFQLADTALCSRLSKADDVKDLFGASVYGDGEVVWEARPAPQLSRVWHASIDGRPQLFLKWVETRSYWAKHDPNASAPADSEEEVWRDVEEEEKEEAAEEEMLDPVAAPREGDTRIQMRVRREERAASYFVVDLESGSCELRIQHVRGRSKETRLNLLKTYRATIEQHVGVPLVGPTVLAPAIRRALIERCVDIVRCWAILPEGGRFDGKKGEFPPVDIRKLQAGMQMKFDWTPVVGGTVRVELDGQLDEILISKPMMPEEHRRLLLQVERWRDEGVRVFTHVEDEPPKRPESPKPPGFPSTAEEWAEIFKLAFASPKQPARATVEPGIDGAIREYIRTHEAQAIRDARPLEQFLTYIEEVAKTERTTYEREIKPVRAEEAWMFRLSAITVVLALVLFTTGTVLLYFTKVTIGTITEILALLAGKGTWQIRSYAKQVKAKRERLEDQQRDSRDTLLAIQTAMTIPDPATRSHAMTEVSLMLLRRVTGATQPPSPPKPAPEASGG